MKEERFLNVKFVSDMLLFVGMRLGVCLGLIGALVWELIGVSVGYIFCGFVIGLLALRGSLGDSISHHL